MDHVQNKFSKIESNGPSFTGPRPDLPVGAMRTVAQTAQFLGISPSFVRKLISQHRIEFVRFGRCVRIPQNAIENLVLAGAIKNAGHGEAR
jgi:excisionase family DNA binding protein